MVSLDRGEQGRAFRAGVPWPGGTEWSWSPAEGGLTCDMAFVGAWLSLAKLTSAGWFLFRLQFQRTNKLQPERTLHEGRQTLSSGVIG